MDSLCKLQLTVLLSHGKLSLPAALSLALLTGFTFSMISLSSSLHGASVLPFMESLFLVSLPHLWHASLSWVTPPCLFLLLNGIIVILTASSGTLSCKPYPPSSAPELLPSVEKDARHDHGNESTTSALTVTRIVAQTSAIVVPDSGSDPSASSPLDHNPLVSLLSSIDDPLSADHCAPTQSLTPDMIMAELPEDLVICDGGSAVKYKDGENDDEEDDHMTSREAFQEVADCSDDGYGDDSTEELTDEFAKGASAPSTPKQSSSSPAWKDSTRRSLSIDSAPWTYDVEGSPEYSLSEEAFKKRIDDYICKVNAKLRSETRYAPLL